MKKRIKTLGELQKHVTALVKRHGEAAPCVAWTVSRDDFVTIGANERDVLADERDVKGMIDDIHLFEYNFIDDHLKRIVGNEKTTRNL
tara:strand:- start:473 stop:736 length:264 start_codon:yes stop_codon:yes gene_type:complete